MGKFGRLAAVVVAVVTGLAGIVLPAGAASADAASTEAAFVAKLNEFRAARGLRQLAVRTDLAELARGWSSQMLGRNDISHNPNLASQAPGDWERLGENVGVGATVQELHDAFVASPTHFRQMVDGAFDAVGIGVVPAPNGDMYVTVNFMTGRVSAPAPAPAPDPAPAPVPAATPSGPTHQAPASASVATESAAPAPAPAGRQVCRKTRKGRVCRVVKASPRKAGPARRIAARRR